MTADSDQALMDRALFWADLGRGRTSPNPIVGAVVVDTDGVVVGQGAHLVAGGPHAEVVALDEAGPRARGGTLYTTLEPCSHTGRTGPCAERIVAAGIARVVSAVTDPNPLVSGRGLAYLRAHQVAVTEGVGAAAAARANAAFLTWVRHARPFVLAKAAVSRDGFVGPVGRPVRLTGAAADRHFHRQRAEVDAIAVGSGTALADDPLLTARGAYRFRPFTRVIVDWRGQVPETARVFSTAPAGPVIMVTSRPVIERDAGRVAALRARGVELVGFEAPDLGAMLGWLGERGVLSLLVEGGPTLHGALADAGLVDRVQLVRTPSVLGEGVRVAPALLRLEAEAGSAVMVTDLGDDRLTEFDVHGTD